MDGRGGGGLHGGIRNNRTNRTLKSRLCKAVEMQGGCERQYWLYAPKLCGGWGWGQMDHARLEKRVRLLRKVALSTRVKKKILMHMKT